jgi:hypothetical protein
MLVFDLLELMRSQISAPSAAVRITSIQSSQSFIPFRVICVDVAMLSSWMICLGSFSVRKVSEGDKQPSQAPEQDENFIFAEPASDDEEETNNERMSQSSDKEEAGRGNIKPTNFKPKEKICGRPTRSTKDDDVFAPVRGNVSAARSEQQDKSSPLRRSRRNGSESANSTPKKARLETSSVSRTKEMTIFITASSKRKKPANKYSSQRKPQGSRCSQSNGESSPESVFKKPPHSTSSIT